MLQPSRLSSLITARLPGVANIDHSPKYRCLDVQLKRACFICRPGIMRLEPYTPDQYPPRPWLECPSFARRSVFDTDIDLRSTVVTHVLEAKKYIVNVEVEMLVPVPCAYDFSGKWKSHPPSKRKRMRSWIRATDAEKLKYAPLAGLPRVPWWAQHPDSRRVERIGTADVTQEMWIFAQDNAPIDDLLQRHSDEWVGRVTEALRC